MNLLISWRNIWRNPRRTIVIIIAVIIGAWSMLFFGAFARGIINSMLANALNTLTGHIQIQQQGFRDDPVVENRLHAPEQIAALLKKQLPASAQYARRIEVNGIASNAYNSEAVSIIGIEPDKEAKLSFYGGTTEEGKLLETGDMHSIVIGRGLVESLETRLGRKLVLMTQNASGKTSSRAFRIKGIYRAELEATEKRYAFISLSAARALLEAEGAVTNFCIKLEDIEQVPATHAALTPDLPAGATILTWEDMLPLLIGYLGIFNIFIILWYIVVFVAMSFGLVNTTLMAVMERIREFGLLKALGMKPFWIVRGVLTECVILLLIGLTLGDLLGLATVMSLQGGIDISFLAEGTEYFGFANIIIPTLSLRDFYIINGIILILGILVCLYPAIKAARITPIEAMAQT